MHICNQCQSEIWGDKKFCPRCAEPTVENECEGGDKKEGQPAQGEPRTVSNEWLDPSEKKKGSLDDISAAMTNPAILIFYYFALLTAALGFYICISLLPDSSKLDEGYYYTLPAYFPSLTVLLAGIFVAAFLVWMGQVLYYLKKV